jgi:hypothetical protein
MTRVMPKIRVRPLLKNPYSLPTNIPLTSVRTSVVTTGSRSAVGPRIEDRDARFHIMNA